MPRQRWSECLALEQYDEAASAERTEATERADVEESPAYEERAATSACTEM